MRALIAAAVLLAAALVGSMAAAIAGRVLHPFELEWMEGATAVHVARLSSGEDLYVRPSLDFVPFAYPPLYYYASAAAASLLGGGFLAIRAVSVVATFGTLLAVFAIVRRESGIAAGLIAAGAYAGAYPLSDGWYDLGRTDGLYVAWLALVYLTAVRARMPLHWAVCGAIAAAAFATKQPAVLAVAPLGFYLLLAQWRAALYFGGTFALLAGLTFVLLNAASEGWYAYYVFEVPRLRMAVSSRGAHALTFWTADLAPMAIALAAGVAAVVMTRGWRHLALAAGLVGASWLARLEGGAWNNAVMPAYLAAAVLLGVALRPELKWPAVRWGLAAAQLALLLFDPRDFVPTKEDVARGNAFVGVLRSSPQPVLIMDHGYWSTQAGLREYAHGWAITDIVWADRRQVGPQLESEVRAALQSQRFGTIIADRERSWFQDDLETHYMLRDQVEPPAPVSGSSRRPRIALGRR